MTTKELIAGVNKTNSYTPNWGNVMSEMNIFDSFWSEDKRLVYYFAKVWYCSDTYVGVRVYFLDDKPVAISFQNARKSHEEFEWIDYKTTYDYVHSLYEIEMPKIRLIDINDIFDDNDYFQIDFRSQIMYDQAYYNEVLVDIVATKNKSNRDVTIKYNSEEIIVKMNEIKFKYNQPLKKI